MRQRQPTTTHLVEEYLRKCDDMVNVPTLAREIGRDYHAVEAAVLFLMRSKVLDRVQGDRNRYYYFALDASFDTRNRKLPQRVPEGPGARPKKQRNPTLLKRSTT